MADCEDDAKTANKYIENESFNDRNSFSGGSSNHGPASACKFQPVRVKTLMDMYESDDDDDDDDEDDNDDGSEDKDRSSDDSAGHSDVDDGQPLPLDVESRKSKVQISSVDVVSSNISAIESKESIMEIITEESENPSISPKSMKNNSDQLTCNSASSSSSTTINTMTTTATFTTMGTNYNHQVYDKSQTIQTYTHDNKHSSMSKELFHDNNERKLSIGRSSISGFSSDFGALDLESKGVRAATSTSDTAISFVQSNSIVSNSRVQASTRSQTFETAGQKSDGNIMSSSIYGNRTQSNTKFDTADPTNPSHDRHIHTLHTNYKAESTATSCSKYDMPISTSQTDQMPLSSNYSSLDTPQKHSVVAGSVRPTPSLSHRNIFQTPQNKMKGDYSLNQNHAPTPGTIFSHWSQNNMMQTPMQNKIADSSQTPGKSILSNHELLWYRNKETKGVRRPLAETMVSDHRILSEKPSHALKTHDTGDNVNRPPLEKSQEKIAMSSVMTQECKENRRPPIEKILDGVTKKDESLPRNKIGESIQENRHANHEVIPKPMPTNIEPLREHYNNPPAIQSRNVQASVPSSIRKTEYGKTMKVKNREYLILGYLGQGMSGEVIRVQDLTSFELRAIKCVDLSRMDKDSAQSCIQEIAMLGKLQAPCIVQMFDYEIRNKTIYVVMEMGDTDLSKFLKSVCAEKRLPLTMILYYWTEMLTAVKHIHDNGVIHSDLKPANFLLVRGRLKLIDFGIASSLNADMTSVVKNSTVGTLNYISPEALMDVGESPNHNSKYKISYKSDVWSLGCILYSLIFGNTPFHNIRQQWAKINAITNPTSKITFAQPTNSEPIPSILIDVVRKCLQHDPKARPSVAQLLDIRYVPIGKQNNINPNIPPNILLKIKSSLNEGEWRQFTEIMDHERRNC